MKIDKEKLEKNASTYSKRMWIYEEDQLACEDGYIAGAERTQMELLNSLWHDGDEKPNPNKPCLLYVEFIHKDKLPSENYCISCFTEYGWIEDNFPEGDNFNIRSWLYIEELVPNFGRMFTAYTRLRHQLVGW